MSFATNMAPMVTYVDGPYDDEATCQTRADYWNSTGSGYYCKWLPGHGFINPGWWVLHD